MLAGQKELKHGRHQVRKAKGKNPTLSKSLINGIWFLGLMRASGIPWGEGWAGEEKGNNSAGRLAASAAGGSGGQRWKGAAGDGVGMRRGPDGQFDDHLP